MLQLIPVTVGIAVSIIVLVAIFGIFPDLMGAFACPAITGDTDGDYVEDAGENWTGDDAADAWSVSCNNLKVQTTVVPVLITLAVVISAILIVTRLFGA
jgi:hypothetical protein